MVRRWKKLSEKELLQEARGNRIPIDDEDTQETIVDKLIRQWFGNDDEKLYQYRIPAKKQVAYSTSTAANSAAQYSKASPEQSRPATASAAAVSETLSNDEPRPSSATQTPQGQQPISLEARSSTSPVADELQSEILRIQSCHENDIWGILGFERGAQVTLQSAEQRYRRLMLILHPDKRKENSVAKAGGTRICGT